MSSKRRRCFCEYCNENIAERTYKRHKAEFFDPNTEEWTKRSMGRIDVLPNLPDSDTEEDKIITGMH